MIKSISNEHCDFTQMLLSDKFPVEIITTHIFSKLRYRHISVLLEHQKFAFYKKFYKNCEVTYSSEEFLTLIIHKDIHHFFSELFNSYFSQHKIEDNTLYMDEIHEIVNSIPEQNKKLLMASYYGLKDIVYDIIKNVKYFLPLLQPDKFDTYLNVMYASIKTRNWELLRYFLSLPDFYEYIDELWECICGQGLQDVIPYILEQPMKDKDIVRGLANAIAKQHTHFLCSFVDQDPPKRTLLYIIKSMDTYKDKSLENYLIKKYGSYEISFRKLQIHNE